MSVMVHSVHNNIVLHMEPHAAYFDVIFSHG